MEEMNPTVKEAINALRGSGKADGDKSIIEEATTCGPVVVWEYDGDVYMGSVDPQDISLKVRKIVGNAMTMGMPFRVQRMLIQLMT